MGLCNDLTTSSAQGRLEPAGDKSVRVQAFFMLSGLCLAAGRDGEAGAQPPRPPSHQAEDERAVALGREIAARVEAGTAAPAADAAAAAGRGEFGLMVTQIFPWRSLHLPGLVCFTPGNAPPRMRALYRHGDAPGPEDGRWRLYADAYNRALADRSDYPDADLCRSAAPGEDWPRDEQAASLPARAVAPPPRSLHEAARRGGAEDVRRLLRTTDVDAFDGLDMTALAWAVARGNGPAAEALLAAGASPWAGPEWRRGWPVHLAAALGRHDWFARLAAAPGRPFERWSNMQMKAALVGGDPEIVALMLREPHEPVRIDAIPRPWPAVALIEALLRDNPALAGPLLRRAAAYGESRAELVRLALAHGADPNEPLPPHSGTEAPLGAAASGIGADSVEIVDLLLRAGADPNAFSGRHRPLWRAVRTMALGRPDAELGGRPRAVFERLLAGGADINLPDKDGVPPVRTLLFPYAGEHRTLDAGGITPALLEMLVRAGLDPNARWQGERVLGPVEAQAGRNSELAVTLRRLGARR
jgi:hypothetical protein